MGMRVTLENSVAMSDFADQYCKPPKNKFFAEEVGMGCTKKVWWRCKDNKSHFFEKSPAGRAYESLATNGCPLCRDEKNPKSNKKDE